MNCPQCGAEVPDSALSCPRCDTPLRQVAFSYLPAGAPPWPSSTPQYHALMSSRASAVAERPVQQSEPPISKRAPQKRWSGSALATLVTLFILTPLIGAGIALGVLAANGQFPAKTIVTNSTPAVPPQGTPGVQGTGQPGQGSGGLQSISSISSSKLHVSMKFPSDWTEDASHTSADSPYVVFRPPSQSGVVLALQRFSSSTSAQL